MLHVPPAIISSKEISEPAHTMEVIPVISPTGVPTVIMYGDVDVHNALLTE